MQGGLRRRDVLRRGAIGAGALALGPALARLGPLAEPAAAAPVAFKGPGPYGPLQPSNPADGVQVPAGFTVREIARATTPIGTTGYQFPPFPDASGSMPLPDGGWILAVNAEVPAPGQAYAGASAIRFDSHGDVKAAYRILSGTRANCGGGVTPWSTWLSGEEADTGLVWEADMYGVKAAVARPALGVFSHEYAVVSESDKRVYLTEDASGGGFYRFTPASWGDLSAGLLEIATLRPDGVVEWRAVPDPSAATTPTRQQVAESSKLARPEGLCVHRKTGLVYFVETSGGRVHQYDPATETHEKVYAAADFTDPDLTDPDNVAVSELSRDLFVCEDPGSLDICLITPDGEVSRFVHLDGPQHGDPGAAGVSETTGPSFDPSGTRLYFSSQRAYGPGALYEVTGPFRTLPKPPGPPGTTQPPAGEGPPPLTLAIHAYRRTQRSRLATQGMRVGLALSATADVTAILRAPVGAKGALVTLAVGRRKATPAGDSKLTMQLTRKGKKYLARSAKPVKGEIVATATGAGGERKVTQRKISIR
jgi:hypothetical protein